MGADHSLYAGEKGRVTMVPFLLSKVNLQVLYIIYFIVLCFIQHKQFIYFSHFFLLFDFKHNIFSE